MGTFLEVFDVVIDPNGVVTAVEGIKHRNTNTGVTWECQGGTLWKKITENGKSYSAVNDITWAELAASLTRRAGEKYNITTAEPISGIVYGFVVMATSDSFFRTGTGDVEIINLYKDTEFPMLGDVSWANSVPPPNSYQYFNVSMDTKSTDNIAVAGHIVLKRSGTDPNYTWTELDYIAGDTFTDYTIYRGGTNWPVTFRVDVVDASGNRTEGAEIYAP